MPKTLTQKNYDKLTNKMMTATKVVAERSMADAVTVLKENNVTDVGVSIDGTWQKRGFCNFN